MTGDRIDSFGDDRRQGRQGNSQTASQETVIEYLYIVIIGFSKIRYTQFHYILAHML